MHWDSTSKKSVDSVSLKYGMITLLLLVMVIFLSWHHVFSTQPFIIPLRRWKPWYWCTNSCREPKNSHTWPVRFFTWKSSRFQYYTCRMHSESLGLPGNNGRSTSTRYLDQFNSSSNCCSFWSPPVCASTTEVRGGAFPSSPRPLSGGGSSAMLIE